MNRLAMAAAGTVGLLAGVALMTIGPAIASLLRSPEVSLVNASDAPMTDIRITAMGGKRETHHLGVLRPQDRLRLPGLSQDELNWEVRYLLGAKERVFESSVVSSGGSDRVLKVIGDRVIESHQRDLFHPRVRHVREKAP